ncbi:OPT oligopeptide transporter protein-domain-containing protein [Geopyxis carbonaria]|nr:OPT oligopeptide transporter protein-domain-containing protein [Geopyxis carbonaria]
MSTPASPSSRRRRRQSSPSYTTCTRPSIHPSRTYTTPSLGRDLELSSLPPPGQLPRPYIVSNDPYLLDSSSPKFEAATTETSGVAASSLRLDTDPNYDSADNRQNPPQVWPPDDHNPSTAGVGTLLKRFYGFMRGAQFTLLRSSPAVGTGSYGALPSSYQGSGNNSEDDANSVITGKDDTSSSEEDQLLSDDTNGAMYTGDSRRRKKPLPMPSEGIRTGVGADGNIDDEHEVAVDMEDEIEDENDPVDNSPYPEVRASVLATDDMTLSISTPRMWTLSILFTVVGSATNLFFSLRYPSISLTPVIALLLAHPLGKIWDSAFSEDDDEDDGRPKNTSNWIQLKRWLGQGKWNRKEHACVYISSNVSFGFAFATDVIVEQTKFYGRGEGTDQDWGIVYQVLLTLSTQILGYTFAGLTRQWLVRPSSMIWPGTLMSTAMFTTLHGEENKPADGWKISRWRFFLIVFCGGFFWYFIPGLLMPALSYFNVLTWFAPDNVVVANMFGVRSGLGILPITFDWAQISYIGSPLMTPFWAAANVVGGLIIVMWIIAPIMYYANSFYSGYMPILSSTVFDNTGKEYDVSRILTKDFLFDEEEYKKYSKVFMPITYVLSYGLQFAALTALVTHTYCWHGKDIWRQWQKVRNESKNPQSRGDYAPIQTSDAPPPRRRSVGTRRSRRRRMSTVGDAELDEILNQEDVHMRLMKKYDECPTSWYLATFVVMIAVGIFVVEYYPVHLPWPGLLLALCVCGVFFVPIGIVMAITNTQSSLFLVCQLICGIIFPGRPVANMVFVMYGYITSTQGLKFAADLKLGHYMKIPPRLLFTVQMVATIIGCLTQISVLNWMFVNIPHICTEKAMNGFTCPIARVHFNGSILWGVVGPQRFFGRGELYQPLIWAFLIGGLSPIAIYALWRYRGSPRGSILRSISLPVLFGSLSWIPPATGLNFSAWAIVCWIFNWVLRARHREWWGKYTMTLSAALDASLAFGLVFIFFGVIYPSWNWVEGLRWWGTEVYKQGCDWKGCSIRTLGEGEKFGPPPGSW